MSELGIQARPRLYLEKSNSLRLPELLAIEERACAPAWSRSMFLAVCQAEGAGFAVAEIQGRVVGFAAFKVTRPPDAPGLGRLKRLLPCHWPWKDQGPGSPHSSIGLLRMAVLPRWQRQGIGRALLEQLEPEARRLGGSIQAVVPESNLPAQLFLRNAGYKAIRILHFHFFSEDGYVMERSTLQAGKRAK